MWFVRYQSVTPNARGAYTGIFGLANGLARSGRLTPSDWISWRANNDWLDAAYPDPAAGNPELFDKAVHPYVTCWFKEDAKRILHRAVWYLDLLDQYDIGWAKHTSEDPGLIMYEDAVQVVVTPHAEH